MFYSAENLFKKLNGDLENIRNATVRSVHTNLSQGMSYGADAVITVPIGWARPTKTRFQGSLIYLKARGHSK